MCALDVNINWRIAKSNEFAILLFHTHLIYRFQLAGNICQSSSIFKDIRQSYSILESAVLSSIFWHKYKCHTKLFAIFNRIVFPLFMGNSIVNQLQCRQKFFTNVGECYAKIYAPFQFPILCIEWFVKTKINESTDCSLFLNFVIATLLTEPRLIK